MRRHVIIVLWCTAVLWWGSARPANAYLDPATTSYLIQIVSALIITMSVGIGVFFTRIQTFLITAQPRLVAWWRHLKGRSAPTSPQRSATATTLLGPELQAAVTAALSGSAGVTTRAVAQPWRQRLFGDDRSWLRRLPLALLAAFGLALPLVCTGPIELYAPNAADLPFGLNTLVVTCLGAAAVTGIAGAALVSLLRGRVFDLTVSLLVGAGLASWVQSLWLNINTGRFMGDQFPWNRYLGLTLLNAAIWAVLIGAPLLVRYLNPRGWRWVTMLVPAVIMAAGVVAAVASVASLGPSASGQTPGTGRYLSVAGINQVSSSKNIIVFLVDATDESVIRDLATAPDFSFGPLQGFTSFDQNVARYQETFPALPFMFTGFDYLWDQPRSQYFQQAYANSPFLPELRHLGYKINIFTAQEDLYWSPDNVSQFLDNLSPAKPRTNTWALLGGMTRLSAFGRAPLALQPSLWLDPSAFSSVMRAQSGMAPPFQIDDAALYQEILNNPLATSGPQPQFNFIHLFAAHQPFTMNAQGQRVPETQTNRLEQAEGAFNIIYTYLSQLRALGLYDSSTILIMADHGTHLPWEQRVLDAPLLPCLFVKPAGAPDVPLQHSSSPTYMTNFEPTIIQAAGGDPTPYGQTYFQVPSATITRRFYWIRPGTGSYTGELQVFDITGDALNFDDWRRVGTLPMTDGYVR